MAEEKNILEKKIDLQVFLKLVRYIRPHVFWFSFCLFLLFAIVALSLAEPVIIGKTIDRYINNYGRLFTVYKFKKSGSFYFRGSYLKREKIVSELPKAKICYIKNSYYIFMNLTYEDVNYLDSINFTKAGSGNGKAEIFNGKKFLEGTLLTTGDLKIIRKDDFTGLLRFSVLFFGLILIVFIINYFQTMILQVESQKIIFRMREEIFTHITGLSHSFFDNNPVGRLVTRVTNDTETLSEMYTSAILNLLKNLVMMACILVVMFIINYRLALLVCLVVPLIILFIGIFRSFARKNYQRMRKVLAEMNSFLQEHIYGMKLIQLFNNEERKFGEFKKASRRLYKSYFREISIFSIFRPSIFILYSLALCLVIFFGGREVLSYSLTFGTLYIFVSYIDLFFRPIQELAEQFNVLQSAIASSERIFLLLDEKQTIPNKKDPVMPGKIRGDIKFKNVWFAYKKDEWVLKNISFSIKEGEKIALVGHTGSGKSTIINLLCRFYDIQKGEITIDGHNIKDMDIGSLRENIGVVMQDVFIFTGSIKNNIRLLNENITDEDIISSGEFVNADRFIQRFPDKYEHTVSERGATLSTGERQLLSFARAVSFNPSILVLDEATSNIDTETEHLIQDALKKILGTKTSIVVAHRLSTIKNCDKIIVIHKGTIRESGNHNDLMKKKGIYYNLYKLNYDIE